MTEAAALQRLLTWLSPAFPVGAFAWSAGLETAIADRRVTDSAGLQNWIEGGLLHGGIRTDAIVLAEAWKAGLAATSVTATATPTPSPSPQGGGEPDGRRLTSENQMPSDAPVHVPPSPLRGGVGGGGLKVGTTLTDLADLVLALTPAAERHKETLLTGDAFVIAARAWPSDIYAALPSPCPYPVAVGAVAAAHGIPLADTLLGYLTAAVHSQVSVAVRLVPLGQSDGLRVMAALEPVIAALAGEAATAGLDAIGGIAYAADIAQMRHETLEPRIFRS